MSKYFEITGYWKDDKTEFQGYIIKEYDDSDEETDDLIFYYGMSEEEIKQAILEKQETDLEFIITDYKEIIL